MTQKCYRVQFTAHLHKLTLALKMQCQIQIVWKRGQKAAYSDKVPLINGQVNFDKKISISCNMVFNPRTKTFQEKMTKFSIIITSQKGVKQAGQILFDVAKFVNQTQLSKKDYDQKLSGCPDKNAKLTYTISGVMKQQLSMEDAISQYPENKNQNPSTIQKTTPTKKKQESYNNNYTEIPTQDKPKFQKSQKKDQKLKQMEDQNKKLRQQLKAADKIREQNEQLRKKIKAQDFKKSSQIKEKIEKYKKQIQKMKSQMRANKKIQDQTLNIEKDIFKCKVKIMKAFNYARESGGDHLVDALQQYCGYTQK